MSRKYKIEEIPVLLGDRKIKLVSTCYQPGSSILTWECCLDGHRWEAHPYHVITRNRGCRVCNVGEYITIDLIKKRLQTTHPTIELVSTEYINNKTNLIWHCSICKHVWKARPDTVLGKNKSGCAVCKKNKKLTIAIIKERIHDKPLKLLSTEYFNTITPLKWCCNICHNIWEMSPDKVIYQDQGCAVCKRTLINSTLAERNKELWLSVPAIVYVISCSSATEKFYKIGLTTNTVKRRFDSFIYDYRIVKQIYTNKYDAVYIEADLHSVHEAYKYTPLHKFNGWTECFSHINIKESV